MAKRVFLQVQTKAGKEQAAAAHCGYSSMGGKRGSSSMSFCGLCFGRPRREAADQEATATEWEQRQYARKVRPSDDDRGGWFGAPDVDEKASDFIARFYASRFTDSERQAIIV